MLPPQDQGSQKDGEGNLVDWWEPETKKKYLERAQCIIDQYSNYTVEVSLTRHNITTLIMTPRPRGRRST